MKNLDRRVWLVLLIQITEVLGFSLILPFLPFYAQQYGASPLMIGLILTTFSFFQFLSSPIMGKLSDFYGRRPLLMLSQLSTMIGFIVLGMANSLWIIFLSRAIDGMLGSNHTIAQAYLSDITAKKDRSKAFSISGIAFSLGFLVGPATGGYLSQFGYHVPAFLAAVIAGLSIVLTYLFLPETVDTKDAKPLKISRLKIMQINEFSKYLSHPVVGVILWQLLFFFLAHFTWTSNFAVYGGFEFGLTATTTGYLLAFVGFISLIIRLGIIPKLVDNFSEKSLILLGMSLIISSMLLTTLMTTLNQLFFTIAIFAFGAAMVQPLLRAMISKGASEKEQGAVMGVTNSVASIAQIVGPILGGWILSTQPPDYLLYTSAVMMTVGLLSFLRKTSQIRIPR